MKLCDDTPRHVTAVDLLYSFQIDILSVSVISSTVKYTRFPQPQDIFELNDSVNPAV